MIRNKAATNAHDAPTHDATPHENSLNQSRPDRPFFDMSKYTLQTAAQHYELCLRGLITNALASLDGTRVGAELLECGAEHRFGLFCLAADGSQPKRRLRYAAPPHSKTWRSLSVFGVVRVSVPN